MNMPKSFKRSPKHTLNICIMAHVDHGKTTLADALVASNGIINQRQAGKIRYMDSRKDEIERGITMKSSCVTLTYPRDDECFVVNLIDSPGHVDFSSEVSTAVRLCDGTIIVVDVVEGLCAQTKVVLKQAWLENIRPVLVLNKIDRLIREMKLDPLDAYHHIMNVLEQTNACMGELYNTDVLGRTNAAMEEKKKAAIAARKKRISESPRLSESSDMFSSWSISDVDDSDLYFIPEKGNVIFASAYDGWGFRLEDFAKLFSLKIGIDTEMLKNALWGDFYLSSKNGKKSILPGAREKGKSPLFVSVILDNIYKVYENLLVRKDMEIATKIADSLGISMPVSIAKSTDFTAKLCYILGNWLPLASSILEMVVTQLPSSANLSEERVTKLMCSATQGFESLPTPTQKLKQAFLEANSEGEVIVFVSKMFAVDVNCINDRTDQNKGGGQRSGPSGQRSSSNKGPLTIEEIRARRNEIIEVASKNSSTGNKDVEYSSNENTTVSSNTISKDTLDTSGVSKVIDVSTNILDTSKCISKDVDIPKRESTVKFGDNRENDEVLIAFARVFSGTVRVGQKVYILGPKHSPNHVTNIIGENIKSLEENMDKFEHIQIAEIKSIYLLMGRQLERVNSAPCGSVIGIGGLESLVIKSATISTTPLCPSFTDLTLQSTPILRVAVEPMHHKDLKRLRDGLNTLYQADPCVEIYLEKNGEYVMVTAGEVHLERCISDLEERYAKVKVTTSSPIVPFRETIIEKPKMDRLNEVIEGENIIEGKSGGKSEALDGVFTVENHLGKLSVMAKPLPLGVVKLLEDNANLLEALMEMTSKTLVNDVDDICRSSLNLTRPRRISESIKEESECLKADTDGIMGGSDCNRPPNSGKDCDTENNDSESCPDRNNSGKKHEKERELIDISENTSLDPHSTISERTISSLQIFKKELGKQFKDAGPEWDGFTEKIWSFGPNFKGPNMLINNIKGYNRPSIFNTQSSIKDIDNPLVQYDTNFNMGFQMATSAGPLCEEPMLGVCFIVNEWEIGNSTENSTLSGQVISLSKDSLRKAFENSHQRLMVAMYSCVIGVTADVVGKVYNVIGRRHGRIIHGDITEGSASWNVIAYLPVMESFNFANELRKETSGEAAMPQLVFSHWEIIPIDPFWVPQTTEELALWGEKADSENMARKYINVIRKRKGLFTDEKIVEFAEKQRTISKNK